MNPRRDPSSGTRLLSFPVTWHVLEILSMLRNQNKEGACDPESHVISTSPLPPSLPPSLIYDSPLRGCVHQLSHRHGIVGRPFHTLGNSVGGGGRRWLRTRWPKEAVWVALASSSPALPLPTPQPTQPHFLFFGPGRWAQRGRRWLRNPGCFLWTFNYSSNTWSILLGWGGGGEGKYQSKTTPNTVPVRVKSSVWCIFLFQLPGFHSSAHVLCVSWYEPSRG